MTVNDTGNEVLRKAAKELAPNDYCLQTEICNTADNPGIVEVTNQIEGEFTPSGLNEALKVTNTTIGTSAVALPGTPLTNRNSLIIQNISTTDRIYIGNNNVTASGANQGWILEPDSFFSLDITDSIQIYAIASTTVSVKILELA